MSEGLTTREAAKTDPAAQARDMRMEATLRIQRLQDHRDDLMLMFAEINRMAKDEPDAILEQLLSTASLSVYRAANATNTELTRLSFIASLITENTND